MFLLRFQRLLTYFFSSSMSFGISSQPRAKMPKLPFSQFLSENFPAFPSVILPPDISKGTGVSLCTFKAQGVAWSQVTQNMWSFSEIACSSGPKKCLSMAEIISVFTWQFPS